MYYRSCNLHTLTMRATGWCHNCERRNLPCAAHTSQVRSCSRVSSGKQPSALSPALVTDARAHLRGAFPVKCQAAEVEAPADDRLPITIITGFLGSGKTTLLNHILTQKHGKKIAIIENEFGEIGIDNDLIIAREDIDGEADLTILENGCLCCTVREDLVVAINKLVERGGFDHIVIETTGLANPAPIISTMILEPSLNSSVRIDGICTVVDSKHISMHLDRKDKEAEDNEACAQLAYADRIVLNKTDLVSADELAALQARIRGINAMASMQAAQNSVVPIDYALGIGGFALEAVSDQVEKELAALDAEAKAHSHDHSHDHEHCDECGESHAPGAHPHSHDHAHDHAHAEGKEHSHDDGHSHAHDAHTHARGHAHDHAEGEEHCDDCGHSHAPGEHTHAHHKHVHDDAVKSASFVIDGAMDLEKVNYWLRMLVQVRGEDIYRMKGILAVDGYDERFVFQGVHMLFEGSPDRKWREDEPRKSKMVFIGRDLDLDLLREGFEDCRVDVATADESAAEPVTV